MTSSGSVLTIALTQCLGQTNRRETVVKVRRAQSWLDKYDSAIYGVSIFGQVYKERVSNMEKVSEAWDVRQGWISVVQSLVTMDFTGQLHRA